MSVISLTKFAGVAPRHAPYSLPSEMAQVAVDCAPYVTLKPLRDNTAVKSGLTAGDPSSIYKFGAEFGNDTLYWFHWPSKIVDVVPGAISGDVSERTYFVEDGEARVTDVDLALLDTDFVVGAAIDWQFAANKALPAAVTFTRSTTATYFDASGVLQTAAINAPRFDHDPETGESLGLLVEEARTNRCLYSADMSAHNLANAGTASLPVVTVNAAVAPDGTMTADRIDFALNGGTTSTDRSDVAFLGTSTTTVGQPYVGSIWLRTVDGSTKTLRFDFNGASADLSPYNSSTLTVDGTWRRFVIGLTSAVDTSRSMTLRLRGTLGTSDSASVYAWGAQNENATIPTSYIPTAAATVTRSADLASVTGASFSGFYNQNEGTLLVEFDRQIPAASSVAFDLLSISNNATTESIILKGGFATPSQQRIDVTDGGVSQASISLATVVAGQRHHIAAAYAANDIAGSFDGGAVLTDTAATLPTVDRMWIGNSASGNQAMIGHISRISYWPKRLTNDQLKWLSGGVNPADYPWNSYKLGVPYPTQVPDVSVGGAGDATIVESRTYIYTFVTADGEESMPSDPSIIVDVEFGQSVTVSNMQTLPPADHNIVAKRIYRSLTGSSATFNFVEEIAVGTASYIDSKLDEELGEVCPSIEWAPVPALTGMFGMANGMVIGWKGKDVIPLEAYRAFAAPEGYRLATEYNIVGGVAIGGTAAILCTTGAPYLLAGNEPSSLSLNKIEVPQGCVSRRSIAAVMGGAVYASPDGLIFIAPGSPPINLTEDLFKKEDWTALSPNSIHGYASEDRYVGFYDTGLAQGGFLFNLVTKSFIYLNFYATAGFNDPLQDELYLKVGTDIVKFESSPNYRTYTWRSKIFTAAAHTNFAAGQVIAISYPVTMRVIYDGVQIHSETVADSLPFRLPAISKARNIEVEISGTREVVAVFLANSVSELKGV